MKFEQVFAAIQKQDQFVLAYKSMEAKKYHVRNLPDWNPGKIIERIGEEHYERHMKMIQPRTQEEFFSDIASRLTKYAEHNSQKLSEHHCVRIAYWVLETVEQFTWCSVNALMKAYCEV